MTISSPAFSNNSTIPTRYTCESVNVSPPLLFSDIPADTKSLVLIVTDPDAPANPWVHWVVFNIPPQTTRVDENSVPIGGVQGYANGGKPGYEGPCPPSGTHRYVFTLYALEEVLDVPSSATRDTLLPYIEKYELSEATLTGIYTLSKNAS